MPFIGFFLKPKPVIRHAESVSLDVARYAFG